MASPCEVLLDTQDIELAEKLTRLAHEEAKRIETKFSRYRNDNIVFEINRGEGKQVDIDDETFRLLQFADQCYQLSEGEFDITSGILRQAWTFDGSNRLPRQSQIDALLKNIGWNKVKFDATSITLPAKMEIDFGGIGKEYAVDRVLNLICQRFSGSVMVNFGGDCHASAPPSHQAAWQTGIENPISSGVAKEVIQLQQGGLATSGDAYRCIIHQGIRYGHILNPKTGWPAMNAPRSVTVAAPTCTDAGILSTLAILQGKNAEAFLQIQGLPNWCFR